ncbi:MAG TPA: ATP-binding protein [Bryobacteraceae bacterium]|nr:ATP-binding protein [Bryobacteraceae bacterium]
MLVIMAGLPATGKSTLARALSERSNGVVLDKDPIRRALFPPHEIEYSSEQDDFCMELMLQTAAYLWRRNPERVVFLDGRTFSHEYQIRRAVEFAGSAGQPFRIIECVCSEATARRRLEHDIAEQRHPAANRDFALYLRVKAAFEPITLPKLIVNTDGPLAEAVAQATG